MHSYVKNYGFESHCLAFYRLIYMLYFFPFDSIVYFLILDISFFFFISINILFFQFLYFKIFFFTKCNLFQYTHDIKRS